MGLDYIVHILINSRHEHFCVNCWTIGGILKMKKFTTTLKTGKAKKQRKEQKRLCTGTYSTFSTWRLEIFEHSYTHGLRLVPELRVSEAQSAKRPWGCRPVGDKDVHSASLRAWWQTTQFCLNKIATAWL
jgi:hypothetical protein